jgi:hypothetical protein
MGGWETALPAPRRKTWVRFFCTDSEGLQVGRDFGRAFDSFELLMFECQPQLRSAMLLEAQEELTDYDQGRLAELLQATSSPQAPAAANLPTKSAPPASFLQRLRPAFQSLLISLFPEKF